jgi:hypothetical protein
VLVGKLNRDELIALVQKIMAHAGSEAQVDAWIREFKQNVPHPAASDLIFWNFKEPLTAEAIVDEALAYRPPRKGE